MPEQVINALREGDTAQALERARAVVAADANDASAHHLLALAQHAAGDGQAAMHSIERAIELAPENASLHLQRAWMLMGARDFGRALEGFGRTLELDPNSFPAYIMQGQLALSRGDLEQAERSARLAERVADGHPWVAAIDAMVALGRGDGERAQRVVAAAMGAQPEDPQLLLAAGHVYAACGHLAFAEQAFRRLVGDPPRTPQLVPLLADLVARQGRQAEAVALLEPLLADPAQETPALRRAAAGLQIGIGRIDDALEHLKRALALAPDDRVTLIALLPLWRRTGRIEEGRQMLEAALATSPGAGNLWHARWLLERDSEPVADAVLARWRRALPDSVEAMQVELGQLRERGREDAAVAVRAEALAQRIIELQPGNIPAQRYLVGRMSVSDPEAAARHIQELLDKVRAPAMREMLHGWLGRLSAQEGKPAEAVANWSAASAILARALLPFPPVATSEQLAAAGPLPPLAPVGDEATRFPILLWGPPGSGVERVGATLAAWQPAGFRADRIGPQAPRDDWQWYPLVSGLLAGKVDPAVLVAGWRAQLPARQVSEDQLIDWLVWWDNSLLRMLRPQLPQARLLVVLRDPRDMLLEWLAFGCPAQIGLPDPEVAAKWLAQVLGQVADLAEQNLFPHQLLRIDGVEHDADGLAARVGKALEADIGPVAEPLPVRYPAGRWREYATALAGPFATLAPVAVRLGYPEN